MASEKMASEKPTEKILAKWTLDTKKAISELEDDKFLDLVDKVYEYHNQSCEDLKAAQDRDDNIYYEQGAVEALQKVVDYIAVLRHMD